MHIQKRIMIFLNEEKDYLSSLLIKGAADSIILTVENAILPEDKKKIENASERFKAEVEQQARDRRIVNLLQSKMDLIIINQQSLDADTCAMYVQRSKTWEWDRLLVSCTKKTSVHKPRKDVVFITGTNDGNDALATLLTAGNEKSIMMGFVTTDTPTSAVECDKRFMESITTPELDLVVVNASSFQRKDTEFYERAAASCTIITLQSDAPRPQKKSFSRLFRW